MYSMKEKYRQNTRLKSSTSSYSRHHQEDEYSERHSRKHDRRSPGMTKQDKYYELMKHDKEDHGHRHRYSDDFDRRGEKRSSKALAPDSKYSRHGHGHDDHHGTHRSRADYGEHEHDVRDRKIRSAGMGDNERGYSMEKKNSVFANLSQAVRKARESHHNGKNREEDEVNSQRWGHSGYKELYQGEHRDDGSHRRSKKPESSFHKERPRESRSRSPIGKTSPRKILAPGRRLGVSKPGLKPANASMGSRSEKDVGKAGTVSKKVATKKPLSSSRGAKAKSSSAKDKEDDDLAVIKALRREREKLLGKSKMASSSRSESFSSDSETARAKPPAAANTKDKNLRKSRSGSKSRSRSNSRSYSSSSRSSEDEDVLELHPRKRTRTNKNSSSSDSRSDSSEISCLASNSGRRSFSLSPNRNESKTAAPAGKTLHGKNTVGAKTGTKVVGKSTTTNSKQSKSTSSPKGSNLTASNGAAKTAPEGQLKSTKTTKKTGDRKESESDSESSSDSDAEPRMSLSERFAKLTQASTDKREFAKPVLSANEIDTKLKVVRDLRNPEARILVDEQRHSSTDTRRRSRPKTPDSAYAEGARRYSSDDRRRHFERMDRDEPSERPADWSDPRVRFTYYRDRGFFNERPLEFEEYVKWEKWWYEYRDWLANEGYYERADGAPGPPADRPGPDARGAGGWQYDRRAEHGRHNVPMFDARERLVRHPPGPPHHGPINAPGPDGRPYFQDPNAPRNRSIGRAADGSLVINVRPPAQYGYRGRGRGPY